jgi:hypothetical protein
MCLLDPPAAFPVITTWAGRYNIRPNVRAAHVAWDHMIDG